MNKKSGNGKVLEFDPTKKRKQKVAKEQSKGSAGNGYKSIKYTAFFILLCVITYILKISF